MTAGEKGCWQPDILGGIQSRILPASPPSKSPLTRTFIFLFQDHVRAAMTCIRFFTHKAKTYTELGEKLSWLLKAKDHLKIYLQETSRRSGRKKTTFFRKKMTASDVSR